VGFLRAPKPISLKFSHLQIATLTLGRSPTLVIPSARLRKASHLRTNQGSGGLESRFMVIGKVIPLVYLPRGLAHPTSDDFRNAYLEMSEWIPMGGLRAGCVYCAIFMDFDGRLSSSLPGFFFISECFPNLNSPFRSQFLVYLKCLRLWLEHN
jgi:hypothetical protein